MQTELHDGESRAFIALGANLGDAKRSVHEAVDKISALPQTRLIARSSLYRSAPVEASGPDFINAVVAVATRLEPLDLLSRLQAIELDHGRERPYRNAPRTLDLDLLLYGDRSFASPTLTVPHPRLHQRAFVLLPLAELAPEIEVPGQGAVGALLPSVAGQAIERLL